MAASRRSARFRSVVFIAVEHSPKRRPYEAIRWRRGYRDGQASGVQGRAEIDVLEPQRLGQEPLLHRAADRAFDILPHCAEAQWIRVFAEYRGLLLPIGSREIEIGRRVAPGPFIGDILRPPEGVEQLERHPGMFAEDAVLHDHVVIGLEEPGPPVIFEDNSLAVV